MNTPAKKSMDPVDPVEPVDSIDSGVLLPGCPVCAYDAGEGVRIEAATQRDGITKWAIRSRFGEVLGSDGEWEPEPSNSARDAAFFARFRFDSPVTAHAVLKQSRVAQRGLLRP